MTWFQCRRMMLMGWELFLSTRFDGSMDLTRSDWLRIFRPPARCFVDIFGIGYQLFDSFDSWLFCLVRPYLVSFECLRWEWLSSSHPWSHPFVPRVHHHRWLSSSLHIVAQGRAGRWFTLPATVVLVDTTTSDIAVAAITKVLRTVLEISFRTA